MFQDEQKSLDEWEEGEDGTKLTQTSDQQNDGAMFIMREAQKKIKLGEDGDEVDWFHFRHSV